MFQVAIDTGGTFTDCLIRDGDTGQVRNVKVPSTPAEPGRAFRTALERAASDIGLDIKSFLGRVDLIVHGTTVATNALLTGSGAKTGMLTTKGFRDVLEIRRGIKLQPLYDLFLPPPPVLVPRYLRLPVEERINYQGKVITPLNLEDVRKGVAELKRHGVQAVAVCFLFSFLNPEHERRAAAEVSRLWPDCYVVTSAQVLPVWREFERFSTAVVSAYLGPTAKAYLEALVAELAQLGYAGAFVVMMANGLVERPGYCAERAVYLLNSGPAAGPRAGVFLAGLHGWSNVVSMDMGGTSFDVCVVSGGEIPLTTESWVGEARVAIKMVEVPSIGAGGGSVGWVDPHLGLLRVGPRSAGAVPGPACYGLGGEEPTVTDAALALGYLADDYFLGGEMRLDRGLALRALERLGRAFNWSAEETASAIFETVNSNMANLIEASTTKKGYDVREFVLVAGGGAGPVHAAFIAERLGLQTVLVPRLAGFYSALGMLAMDLGRDYAQSYVARTDRVDLEAVNEIYRTMEEEAFAAFAEMGIGRDRVVIRRSADMRYVGQFHELEVEVPPGWISEEELQDVVRRFHERHQELYAFSMRGRATEVFTLRVHASVSQRVPTLASVSEGRRDSAPPIKRKRAARFGRERVEALVYEAEALRAGDRMVGPAIIEERTTTVVVPPGFTCEVDSWRNYVLRRG